MAQDIITLTSGTKIRAKVLEINPDDIKYKDFNNQDGPTTTIQKNTVAEIRYANGTKTVITTEDAAPAQDGDRPRPGSFRRGPGGRRDNTERTSSGGAYRKKTQKDARINGWYFGLGLPIGNSMATNKDPNYTTASESYNALTILATKMFNQHIGVQVGLGVETYSYVENYSPTSPYTYANDLITLGTLLVPIRAVYFSNSKKRAGLYVMAGVDLSLLADARDEEQDDLKSNYNSLIVSPFASAGVEFRTRNAHGVWMFGPFYKSTMSNFYSTGSGNTGMLSSVGLSVEYLMKFGSRGGHARR